MQIVVMGMHRSGTSMLTRLVNMSGAYFGPESISTGQNAENPKGFWERRDIRKVNDAILKSASADWDRPLGFGMDRVPDQARSEQEKEARSIIQELDTNKPWVAKEPRFCLTLPFWRPLLKKPIALHIIRDPLEVARSLQTRNRIPVPVGIALWEHYVLASIQNSAKLPRVVTRHEKLIRDPASTLSRMLKEFAGLGVRGLSLPGRLEIGSFVSDSLYRARADKREVQEYLLRGVREVWKAVSAGRHEELLTRQLSAPSREALEGYAALSLRNAEQMEARSRRAADLEKRLSEEVRSARERQVDQVRTLADSSARLDEARQALRDRDGRLKQQEEDLRIAGEVRGELSIVRRSLEEREAQTRELEEQLSRSREESGELAATIRERTLQLESRLLEINEARETARRLRLELRTSEERIGQVREEMEKREARIHNLEEEIGTRMRDLERVSREAEQIEDTLRTELRTEQERLGQVRAQMDRTTSRLEAEIRDRTREREDALRSLAELKSTVEEKEKKQSQELDGWKKRAQLIEGKIAERTREIGQLREQVAELGQVGARLSASLSEHEKVKTDLETEAERSAAQIAGLMSKLESRDRQQQDSNQEATRLNKRLQQANAELKQLGSQLEENSEQIDAVLGEARALGAYARRLDEVLSTTLTSKRVQAGQILGDVFQERIPASLKPLIWKTGRVFYRMAKALVPGERSFQLDEEVSRIRMELYHLCGTLDRYETGTGVGPGVAREEQPERGNTIVSIGDVPGTDIVVCIHDALEDVRHCLNSLIRKTPSRHRLILVNDGSGIETTEFLREFSKNHTNCLLLENKHAEGYTRAANKGMKASTAEYVVLLNSDTIVTDFWLERLIRCGESDPRLGIVGPLSNAASWQSVPERHARKGDWAVNQLPTVLGPDEVAGVAASALPVYRPRVPLLNGFCLAIKRTVIQRIGYFNESMFPHGYGEENDYCFRAQDNGFELAVAADVFVFHAKSKSYSHDRRKHLSRAGSDALRKRYGNDRLERAEEALSANPELARCRDRIGHLWRSSLGTAPGEKGKFRVLFLAPMRPGSGGVHSVVQEAAGMRGLGADAQVAIRASDIDDYKKFYRGLMRKGGLFFSYRDSQELLNYASGFDTVVATINSTVPLLRDIVHQHGNVVPAYYIQDYEPYFYPEGSAEWATAFRSYTLLPKAVLFAKTRWLCDTVMAAHPVRVHKVRPGLDRNIFHPPDQRQVGKAVRIAAMIRPSTPRRGAARTMRVLKHLKEALGDRVEINLFGCHDTDREFRELERRFDFSNHGVLTRERVADLLRFSDVFVDFSSYQAFGRSSLEAMACGAAVVLPKDGGVGEFAIDHVNALLIDSTSEDECLRATETVCTNHELRFRLQTEGLLTTNEYTISQASASELAILQCNSTAFRMPNEPPVQKIQKLPARRRHSQINHEILQKRVEEYLNAKSGTRKRVVVYTAISNNYDVLKIPEILCPEWDYVCFTDRDTIPGSSPWKVRHLDFISPDNTRTARYVKTHPHSYFPDYEYSIWIDAHILITSDYLEAFTNSFMSNAGLFAAIPHPFRRCTFEEGRHCIIQAKDDSKLIESQMTRYREEGLPENWGLIESQILVRRHNSNEVRTHSENWWNEIEGNSKRDQLSLMYVLWKQGLDWKPIIEGGLSTRNHPGFSFFQHGLRETNRDIGYVIPEFLPTEYATGTRPFWSGKKSCFDDNELDALRAEQVDIVVCVHNALEDVERCFTSVLPSILPSHSLIIVDDGSNSKTRQYLEKVARRHDRITLIRHEEAKGYTISANTGMKASTAPFVILLNSDTIVTGNWVLKLLQAAQSSPDIGVVGPMSNAASWQSVPYLRDPTTGEMAINKLPQGITVADMDRLLEHYGWFGQFPRVPLVNGFCYGVKREVFEAIGYFDEAAFPIGYGEEDDYSQRVRDAGFILAIATHCYVYHAKSKSFGKQSRQTLAEAGGKTLRERHGADRIDQAVEFMKQHPVLQQVRSDIGAASGAPALEKPRKQLALPAGRSTHNSSAHPPSPVSTNLNRLSRVAPEVFPRELSLAQLSTHDIRENARFVERMKATDWGKPKSALWILPSFANILAGGIRTIFMVAEELSKSWGTSNTFLVCQTGRETIEYDREVIHRLFPGLRFTFQCVEMDHDPDNIAFHDVAICSSWPTAYFLAKFNRCRAKFYFMQDYESLFYPAGSVHGLIEQTYKFGFYCIANSPGIADKFKQFSKDVDCFIPGVDTNVFFPPKTEKRESPWQVVFYGRPTKHRNAFALGTEVLRRVKNHLGERVRIVCAGSNWKPEKYELSGIVENLGVLDSLESVANLYRQCHAGVISMLTPHPSYQPLEYMASGCVTVTNENSGTQWLFQNGKNAMVTTILPEDMANGVIRVLEDRGLRSKVVKGGLETVSSMRWSTAFDRIKKFVASPKSVIDHDH